MHHLWDSTWPVPSARPEESRPTTSTRQASFNKPRSPFLYVERHRRHGKSHWNDEGGWRLGDGRGAGGGGTKNCYFTASVNQSRWA